MFCNSASKIAGSLYSEPCTRSGRINSPHCDARGTTFIAASPVYWPWHSCADLRLGLKIIRLTVLIIAPAFDGFKCIFRTARPPVRSDSVDNSRSEKGIFGMEKRSPADLARALYAALAAGDREQLDALLHPEFSGRIAEGM